MMKKRLTMVVRILLITLVINLTFCTSKKKEFNFKYFYAKERSFYELKKYGFKLETGHSTVLIKEFDSIRAYYVLGFDRKPFTKTIEMNIEKCDSISISKFLYKNNCTIISKFRKVRNDIFFRVKNDSNQLFDCSINNDEKYNFSISFTYGG